MKQITEQTWITEEGLLATIVFTTSGHRCGYVAVPTTHPAYKLNYYTDSIRLGGISEDTFDQIQTMKLVNDISVHGGLTYSDEHTDTDELWFFGFDAAHCDDKPDYELARKYYATDIEIIETLNHRAYVGGATTRKVRSRAYMTEQCISLSKQLADIEQQVKDN